MPFPGSGYQTTVTVKTSKNEIMEQIVNLHIERLPEGVWLAISEDVPGLVAQGKTISETLETARDVAKKIIEARAERAADALNLEPVGNTFDCPLIIGA